MSAASDYADVMSAQRAKFGNPNQYLDTRNAQDTPVTQNMLNKRNATQTPASAVSNMYEALAAHADKLHPVK